jgi:hypothetical protein
VLSFAFSIFPSHAGAVTGFTPLIDMGVSTYLGFGGGLYENGTNSPPTDHAAAGIAHAASVRPLDASGSPSASGKMVLLSIGMSNTTQEWCSPSSALPCDSYTLMGQAATSASVNHTTLVIVNGAAGGQAASTWDSPADLNYDRVRDTRLAPSGVTEQQVQAVWLKLADSGPTVSLPSAASDAYALETFMGNVVRALKTRYPNLQLVFASSRIYAGYATMTTLNPEPYAYESGFSVKWLIQAQIDQMRNGGPIVDTRAGDLNLATGAPWIAWGPYLWADGTTPRSDGLTWVSGDLVADGTHPSISGRTKVADMLMSFFLSSPFAQCRFAVPCSPAAPPSVGGMAEQPDLAALPSAASSGRDYTLYILGAAVALLAAAGAAGWRRRRL